MQNKYYQGYFIPEKKTVLGGVLKKGTVRYHSREAREWAGRFHGYSFHEGASQTYKQFFNVSIYNQHFALALPTEHQFKISIQNSEAEMINYRVVGMSQTHYIIQKMKGPKNLTKINKQDLRIIFLKTPALDFDMNAIMNRFFSPILLDSNANECSNFLLKDFK